MAERRQDEQSDLRVEDEQPVRSDRTIWKFPVPWPPPSPVFKLEMPLDAKVLCVRLQNRIPMIWAQVTPSDPLVSHRFAVVGTGHRTPDAGVSEYIGTIQMFDGTLVLHFFRLTA